MMAQKHTLLLVILLQLVSCSRVDGWLTSGAHTCNNLVTGSNLVPSIQGRSQVEGWLPSSYPYNTLASSLQDRTALFAKYDLGLGKNQPVEGEEEEQYDNAAQASQHWVAPTPVSKPENYTEPEPRKVTYAINQHGGLAENSPQTPVPTEEKTWVRSKKLVASNQDSKDLRNALWDESHYQEDVQDSRLAEEEALEPIVLGFQGEATAPPKLLYPDIDLSIPPDVYSEETDAVWELMRYEAYREAQREPLLVSFLHSTILNHKTLESALAFHLANCLSSPAMISTQIQSLILEALDHSADFRKSLRADLMAVRDRDPACTCLPDVFLYFKGFHALQTHRVAHFMYKNGHRQVLAHYLQSQVSQNFQIDIHPNATLGSGIMLDHGTGIVIGETATVGHNCSILHHVTLGGSGKKGVDRHPKVGSGVLLGAGASVLGNIKIGEGCQIGAGTLVISDLPAHSVAVGVPAKIIGRFVDVTSQPSIDMNQMTGTRDFDEHIRPSFESGEFI